MRETEQYISPIWKEQEREEELGKIGREILRDSANELYLSMRFLDTALNALELIPDPAIGGLSTDGSGLYYQPEQIAALYRRNRLFINRAYLHSVLHCLFCHMWTRGVREETLWNLSCDIAVESVIDGLQKPCVHLPKTALRQDLYSRLSRHIKVFNAESVFHGLQKLNLGGEEFGRFEREFCRDDHSLWNPERKPPRPNQTRNRKEDWDEKRAKVQLEMETHGDENAEDQKDFMDQLAVENRERWDYRRFLKKFSVLRETVQVDPDAFDYVFYNYGMELYGNMPLLEPLETREIRRVEDFVIVIDTSMSCSGDLVRRFLEETYGVLSQSETYFKKVNIHIIQCDDRVRQDVKIENEEELRSYMDHMELSGLGGTDFRPAFLYVDQLVREQKFDRLKGLLYFNDGKGTYPVKMPSYDTAFVFIRNHFYDADVPPWAMKVMLDEEQLMETGEIDYEY